MGMVSHKCGQLEQQSPTFLALGSTFLEDKFSKDQGVGE